MSSVGSNRSSVDNGIGRTQTQHSATLALQQGSYFLCESTTHFWALPKACKPV